MVVWGQVQRYPTKHTPLTIRTDKENKKGQRERAQCAQANSQRYFKKKCWTLNASTAATHKTRRYLSYIRTYTTNRYHNTDTSTTANTDINESTQWHRNRRRRR